MFLRLTVLIISSLLCIPVFAGDGVISQGVLSDKDFYRAVSCGAPKGGKCIVSTRHFSDPRLTISLSRTKDAKVSRQRSAAVHRALRAAIAQINASGSRLQYRLVQGSAAMFADVKVFLVKAGRGQTIRSTNFPGLDRVKMQGAISTTLVSPFKRKRIIAAGIAISSSLRNADLPGVMLEEMLQATGLRFDLQNPNYTGVSVFAQKGNAVARIKGQDVIALRRHYPR